MTGTQKFVLGLASLFVVFCLGCMGCVTLGSLASAGQPTAVANVPTATAPAFAPPPAAPASAPTRLPPTATPVPAPPAPTQAPPPPPPPAATRTPAPPKPTSPPPPPPPPPAPGSDLAALVAYAQVMKPILDEAEVIVKRDAEILEASENAPGGGNDAVLCDGRLAADIARMRSLVNQARGISPPPEAATIHRLVVESGESWTKALEHVDAFCRTKNGLYKAGAAVEFWKAALQFRDAAGRFYWLLAAKGIEALVQ